MLPPPPPPLLLLLLLFKLRLLLSVLRGGRLESFPICGPGQQENKKRRTICGPHSPRWAVLPGPNKKRGKGWESDTPFSRRVFRARVGRLVLSLRYRQHKTFLLQLLFFGVTIASPRQRQIHVLTDFYPCVPCRPLSSPPLTARRFQLALPLLSLASCRRADDAHECSESTVTLSFRKALRFQKAMFRCAF
jgi:hypothetical protein